MCLIVPYLFVLFSASENWEHTSTAAADLTPTARVADYFTHLLLYTKLVKQIADGVAIDIEGFVKEEFTSQEKEQYFPITLIILLAIFVPCIIYVTSKATITIGRCEHQFNNY